MLKLVILLNFTIRKFVNSSVADEDFVASYWTEKKVLGELPNPLCICYGYTDLEALCSQKQIFQSSGVSMSWHL